MEIDKTDLVGRRYDLEKIQRRLRDDLNFVTMVINSIDAVLDGEEN